MFGSSKNITTIDKPILDLKQIPIVNDVDKLRNEIRAIEKYRKLASELKIDIGLSEEIDFKLKLFLIESEIFIYPNEVVRKFLIEQCPKDKLWVWKPLREKDKGIKNEYNRYNHGQIFNDEKYTKPVPYEILNLMKNLLDKREDLNSLFQIML